MDNILIYNANIITPIRVINNGSVLIKNGKIEAIKERLIESSNCIKIDAKGNYLSPGFIDIHTHGGGNADFMDGTKEAILTAANVHREHGTTSLVATTLTSSDEELFNTFEMFKGAKKDNKSGAKLLGLHLEGPYFSPNQKGAQDPRYLKNPTPLDYFRILSKSDDIIRWSVAPELPGALEMGIALSQRNILPSIGHTDAIYEEVVQALECGYTHITHFYSCVSTVVRKNLYKFAGVIESAYLLDDLTVEIIADGKHVPEPLLKLIYKIKGPDRIALVTDSMRAAGTDSNESILGSLKDGQKVIIEDDVAKLPDRSAFAGSVATADRLIRNMIGLASVPIVDAVKMMTLTPAKIIGVDKQMGSIAVSKDANLVIFDKDINIKKVIIDGSIL